MEGKEKVWGLSMKRNNSFDKTHTKTENLMTERVEYKDLKKMSQI